MGHGPKDFRGLVEFPLAGQSQTRRDADKLLPGFRKAGHPLLDRVGAAGASQDGSHAEIRQHAIGGRLDRKAPLLQRPLLLAHVQQGPGHQKAEVNVLRGLGQLGLTELDALIQLAAGQIRKGRGQRGLLVAAGLLEHLAHIDGLALDQADLKSQVVGRRGGHAHRVQNPGRLIKIPAVQQRPGQDKLVINVSLVQIDRQTILVDRRQGAACGCADPAKVVLGGGAGGIPLQFLGQKLLRLGHPVHGHASPGHCHAGLRGSRGDIRRLQGRLPGCLRVIEHLIAPANHHQHFRAGPILRGGLFQGLARQFHLLGTHGGLHQQPKRGRLVLVRLVVLSCIRKALLYLALSQANTGQESQGPGVAEVDLLSLHRRGLGGREIAHLRQHLRIGQLCLGPSRAGRLQGRQRPGRPSQVPGPGQYVAIEQQSADVAGIIRDDLLADLPCGRQVAKAQRQLGLHEPGSIGLRGQLAHGPQGLPSHFGLAHSHGRPGIGELNVGNAAGLGPQTRQLGLRLCQIALGEKDVGLQQAGPHIAGIYLEDLLAEALGLGKFRDPDQEVREG